MNGWQGAGAPEITDTPPQLLTPVQCGLELLACLRRLDSGRRRPPPGQRSYERQQHSAQVERTWRPRARQLAEHLLSWLEPPTSGGAA